LKIFILQLRTLIVVKRLDKRFTDLPKKRENKRSTRIKFILNAMVVVTGHSKRYRTQQGDNFNICTLA
jgi:hypothetical protein